MHTNELRALIALDRQAVAASVAALAGWDGPARPTPCVGWDLGDLVAHMTVQQRGFARAVAGERTALSDWTPRPAADPVAAYSAACGEVDAAFAALHDPDAPVLLPEIREHPLPTHVVVGFHLVDNVVHAWDVAASLGAEVALGDDVLRAALAVARQVPDDAGREREGAAFAPARPVGERPALLDEILLRLGRDPRWSPR